jgi:hypothetical protein
MLSTVFIHSVYSLSVPTLQKKEVKQGELLSTAIRWLIYLWNKGLIKKIFLGATYLRF